MRVKPSLTKVSKVPLALKSPSDAIVGSVTTLFSSPIKLKLPPDETAVLVLAKTPLVLYWTVMADAAPAKQHASVAATIASSPGGLSERHVFRGGPND